MQQQKPQVIFIVGGPGSGKGTQCKLLKEKFGFEHLSTGSLLREYTAKIDYQQAKPIIKLMSQGALIPSLYVVRALQYKIFQIFPKKKIFLLDGIPRNSENYQCWEKVIKDTVNVRFLLFIECDLDKLKQRLLNRAKIQKRIDDNPQTIQKRFQTFHNYTQKFCDQYKKSHKSIYVNGMGGVQQVAQRIQKILKEQGVI